MMVNRIKQSASWVLLGVVLGVSSLQAATGVLDGQMGGLAGALGAAERMRYAQSPGTGGASGGSLLGSLTPQELKQLKGLGADPEMLKQLGVQLPSSTPAKAAPAEKSVHQASPVSHQSAPMGVNAGGNNALLEPTYNPLVHFESNDVSDEAFAKVAQSAEPLSPEQIRTLRYLVDRTENAAAASPIIPPKPTSSSIVVNMSTGATPPVIRMASGFITSLVFLDATGAPWPIKAYDLGDPQSFNIQWDKKGNTLLVQAQKHYQSANLAVMLRGLNAPIMVTLMPGQHVVDYRVDLRVPSLGPQAAPSFNGMPGTANSSLLSVLDGIPPSGGKEVNVSDGQSRAWVSGNLLYLRTRTTLLSPSWTSSIKSADGTHAYALPKSSAILVSQHGKITQLTIQGL